MQISMDKNGQYFANIKSDRLHPTETVRVEGPTEESIKTALNLLSQKISLSIEQIVAATGLTEDEITHLM